MNKRIRELYNQSLVVQNDDAQWIESELDSEKFAELIVRECAKIGEDYGDDGLSSDPEGNRYPLNAGIAIRKHFGVEE